MDSDRSDIEPPHPEYVRSLESHIQRVEARLASLEAALVENRVLVRVSQAEPAQPVVPASSAAAVPLVVQQPLYWTSRATPTPVVSAGQPAPYVPDPTPLPASEEAGGRPTDRKGHLRSKSGSMADTAPAGGTATSETIADPAVSHSSSRQTGDQAAPRVPPPQPGTLIPNLAGFLGDLEERLTGRALALVGGIALVLGAILFLSLAFSRNWIGPEGRVVIGLVAGGASLAGGAALIERRNRLLGHVLTPLGLAVISISLVGATRLYALIPIELGLSLALASAAIAAVIAIRSNSQLVAGFGLVAVLAAPPLLGATPDLATLAFVGVALVGTTAIALWRTWSWLPPAAFLLAAPQAASWMVGRPDPSLALPASVVFWVLNEVAAGGEEFRRRRNDLSPSAASLLVANAAFLVWSGFSILGGDLEPYRGVFLLLVALAHLGIGGYFIARDGDLNLFGLLVIGTGVAALTMAVPVQLGAPWVPVAWTAEAVALAWVAVRRAHIYGAVMAATLYGLVASYLVILLYPADRVPSSGIPFVNGPGGVLAFFLTGVGLGVWIVTERSARSALAALGLLVVAWCASIELVGPSITVALAALAAAGAGVYRYLPTLHERPIAWRVSGLIPKSMLVYPAVRRYVLGSLPAALFVVGAAATARLVVVDYGSAWLAPSHGIPFVDPAGAALLGVLLSLALVATLGRDDRLRDALIVLGNLVFAWACARELDGVALVGAWAALGVGTLAVWGLRPASDGRQRIPIAALLWGLRNPRSVRSIIHLLLPGAAIIDGVLALGHVASIELPIALFGQVLPPTVPFTDAGAAAAALLMASALSAGFIIAGPQARRVSIVAAGAIAAYTVPYEVYAWAVVVLWAAITVATVVGAHMDRIGERIYLRAGLGMLIATGWVAIGIVAPPSRLVVTSDGVTLVVALQSVAALASLVIALGILTWFERSKPWIRRAEIATAIALVYLLSVAAVDAFATRVGGAVATEELQKQGQVALSVIWAISGVVAFVAGLRFRRLETRLAGLALLALATAKVFLFDLSALDVAYRVVSLIALGLILLVSAGLWQRMQPPHRVESSSTDVAVTHHPKI